MGAMSPLVKLYVYWLRAPASGKGSMATLVLFRMPMVSV